MLIRLHQAESEEEDEDEEESEETALRPTSQQIAKIKLLAEAKRQELNSDEDTAFDENGVDSDDDEDEEEGDDAAEQKDDEGDEEDEDSEFEEEAAAASAGGASAKRSWTCSACGHDNLTSGNPNTATVHPDAACLYA